MKKKIKAHRKLRKCERGIKTKKLNHGCRYVMTNNDWLPRIDGITPYMSEYGAF